MENRCDNQDLQTLSHNMFENHIRPILTDTAFDERDRKIIAVLLTVQIAAVTGESYWESLGILNDAKSVYIRGHKQTHEKLLELLS